MQPLHITTNTYPDIFYHTLIERNFLEFAQEIICSSCASLNPQEYTCLNCRKVTYCSEQCWHRDWVSHRLLCTSAFTPEFTLTINGHLLKGGKAKIKEWDVSFFSPAENLKELSYFTIIESMSFIHRKFLKDIKNFVLDYTKSHSEASTVTFNNELVFSLFNRKLSDYQNLVDNQIFPILLDKIRTLTFEFFKNFGSFQVPVNKVMRKRFLNKLCSDFESNMLKCADNIHPNHHISPFDRLSSEVFLGKVPFYPRYFSCVSYALYKTGETRAAEFIFNENQGQFIRVLPSYLKEWGYQSVTNPQEGDLVLYFISLDDTPKHVGIYQSSGTVDSKLGIFNAFTCEHQIFDMHSAFGKKVVFFRKMST
jgi:hypothetical protein